MKTTIKKILFTLLLSICILTTSATSYSAATAESTEGCDIEFNSFDDEDHDLPIAKI